MTVLLVLGGSRDVSIADDTVTAIGGDVVLDDGTDRDRVTLDASDCIVAPGLVDLQVNGLAGIDLTLEPERLGEVAAALPRHGVTAFAPTLISCPPSVVTRAIAAVKAFRSDPWRGGARVLGLHLEGPFLNPARPGAHPPEHLRPADPTLAGNWAASGEVGLMTLAPELPDGVETVAALASAGVIVCAGHSTATLSDIDRAAAAGLRGITHLFNAMPGLDHRSPGLVLAGLGARDLIAGMIADLVHVSPEVVDLAWRANRERLMLVSDSIAAAGLGDGEFQLGATRLSVTQGVARTADGTLAGSTATLDQAVRNLATATGCPVTDAIRPATMVPAALLGRTDIGSLQVGGPADLIIVESDGTVTATVIGGRLIYDRDGRASQDGARWRS